MDNCVADDRARIPLIDWAQSDPDARYAPYHTAAIHDPAPRHRHLFEAYHTDVVIFTARPERFRADTQAWMRRHGITCRSLHMRGNEDRRASVVVKEEQLLRLLRVVRLREILAALDDRPDICAMYERYRIPAVLTSIHDVCAYTPPPEIAKND